MADLKQRTKLGTERRQVWILESQQMWGRQRRHEQLFTKSAMSIPVFPWASSTLLGEGNRKDGLAKWGPWRASCCCCCCCGMVLRTSRQSTWVMSDLDRACPGLKVVVSSNKSFTERGLSLRRWQKLKKLKVDASFCSIQERLSGVVPLWTMSCSLAGKTFWALVSRSLLLQWSQIMVPLPREATFLKAPLSVRLLSTSWPTSSGTSWIPYTSACCTAFSSLLSKVLKKSSVTSKAGLMSSTSKASMTQGLSLLSHFRRGCHEHSANTEQWLSSAAVGTGGSTLHLAAQRRPGTDTRGAYSRRPLWRQQGSICESNAAPILDFLDENKKIPLAHSSLYSVVHQSVWSLPHVYTSSMSAMHNRGTTTYKLSLSGTHTTPYFVWEIRQGRVDLLDNGKQGQPLLFTQRGLWEHL